ncbi:MAG: tetratricopeptide repeat protein [Deltaproteobacteria bacterium]|jgi:pentatricopeptide repeat protein|nr:tetratricopeptide repeat protein [Deltaproteobacteria bacterium]MBW2518763.1 tetratricopeptide repeat protein [Deltaproteobacteria bacterium]
MTQGTHGGNLISKIESYLQIVTKDPRSTAFVPLAEAYRQVGLLDDALEAARLGTHMLPHFSPGFATLGRILGQIGRIDEAMAAYARALDIDSESQVALAGLARLYMTRGERDEARRVLRQGAECHPGDETFRNMLKALDLPRPWAEIHSSPQVEDTCKELGQGTLAPVHIPEEGKPIPTATLAEIYVRQGLIDKAIKVYEEIHSADPENGSVRARLEFLRQSGQEGLPDDGHEQQSHIATSAKVISINGRKGSPHEEEASGEKDKSAETDTQSLLAIFERWLNAIQQRKSHV